MYDYKSTKIVLENCKKLLQKKKVFGKILRGEWVCPPPPPGGRGWVKGHRTPPFNFDFNPAGNENRTDRHIKIKLNVLISLKKWLITLTTTTR